MYLPAGVWTALDDDARYVGPRTVRVAAPLERIPIFARGGSVIADAQRRASRRREPEEPLVLEVYPGRRRDDGRGRGRRRVVRVPRAAMEARTPVRLRSRAGGRLRLEVGAREGAFAIGAAPCASRCTAARRRPRCGSTPCGCPSRVPDEEIGATWHWEGGVLHVRWSDVGTARSLEVDPRPERPEAVPGVRFCGVRLFRKPDKTTT